MDVLKVNEKDYVKASVIARDLGYTADYVGQLCRSGKVDAKLVGRSWYVDRNSISGHKKTRYRSTKTKSLEAVHLHIEDTEKRSVTPKVAQSRHFYTYSTQMPQPRYSVDDTELLPALGKSAPKKGSLQVNLADASEIKISSKNEEYVFEAPQLPEIKFKGTLSVTEFDTNEVFVKDGGVILHPKEVNVLTSEKKANNLAISDKHESEHPVKKHKKNEHQLVPVQLDNPEGVTAVVHEVIPEEKNTNSHFIAISLSVVCSAIVVVLLLGLETHFIITHEYVVSSIVFHIDHTTAAVHEALSGTVF